MIHPPPLRNRRKQQDTFHPSEWFADAPSRSAPKGEICKLGQSLPHVLRPPLRDETFRIREVLWIMVVDVLADYYVCILWKNVVTYSAISQRLSDQNPRWRIDPHRLRKHLCRVVEFGEIVSGGKRTIGNDTVDFLMPLRSHCFILRKQVPSPRQRLRSCL